MVAGIPKIGTKEAYEKALTVYEEKLLLETESLFVSPESGMGRPHAEPNICHESPILGILSATTIITEFALESSKQSDDIGWRPWLPGFPRSRPRAYEKALTVYEEKLLLETESLFVRNPAWGDPMPSPTFVMRARSWESSRQPLSSPSLLSSRANRVMI